MRCFGKRYYDPEIGVWTACDPKDQLFNAYGYATNPISYVDPNGEYIIGAIVGALVMGYGSGVLSSGSFNPGDWKAQDWFSAGLGAFAGAKIGSSIEDKILMNRIYNNKSGWYGYQAYTYYVKTGAWNTFMATKMPNDNMRVAWEFKKGVTSEGLTEEMLGIEDVVDETYQKSSGTTNEAIVTSAA